ncbi:acyltransferase [Flavobacterium sp. SORGH_AS_0622]|uniref:acyltransferase family protein n=1 Tax=Flavobacterium sp. SORGH_AS_0622 TaxID=3041772 RepID=UPI00277E474A|nr:acyltransferase [Flavobacterium sp. SORGH_AS_0622]MDQ1165070.1 peptidoglycan/LPS O-acetylase OafA/YrhL [Flavobacterium sp. SORGH_AS_0622]
MQKNKIASTHLFSSATVTLLSMIFSVFIFLIPILVVLILSVFTVNKIIKIDLTEMRYPEIDGLRGYLAFFVFLHHAYIWQIFLKTSTWKDPESNLFNQFGETSVVFFFIITVFLFTTKLFKNKTGEIDWLNYLKSRFFRLFPMYFFFVIIIFIIVGVLTQFTVKVPFIENLKSIISWLFFNVSKKSSDLNGLKDTFIINSGIAWTLPYEWTFYFLVPLIALWFKIKVNLKAVLSFTFAAAIIMVLNKSSLRHFTPFLGGIIVALIMNMKKTEAIFKQKKYTILALLLLGVSVYFFNGGKKPIQIIISSLVFLIIASGNSFFGILSSAFSRKFGQITYSLYLLHGIFLFILFHFVVGLERAKTLTHLEFWMIVTVSILPLLFICQLTFKYIESPLMSFSKTKK